MIVVVAEHIMISTVQTSGSHLLPLTTFNHHTHPLDQTPKDVTLRYTSTNMTTVPNAAEQQDQQPQVPKAILYSWQTSVWVSPGLLSTGYVEWKVG